jgi:hypothetical protein
MKICFLDIDGVFFTEQAYFYWERKPERKEIKRSPRLCPIAISNLNYLCSEVEDLRLVISSTWRLHHSLEDLLTLLEEDGFSFKDRIIGVTPCRSLSSGDRRNMEIESWLEKVADVTEWVAIDDHQFDIPLERLCKTEQEDGFTIMHAYALVKRFKPEWEQPLFLM